MDSVIKTKICPCCKQGKLLDRFRLHTGGKNKGYIRSYCRECENKKANQYYHTTKGRKPYERYYLKNKAKIRERSNEWLKNYPWYRAYNSAQNRCNTNKKCNYWRKGIKLLMKPNDFKFLWFRDKAYLMNHPSIHRINVNGNYEINNCQYVEWIENIKEGGRIGGAKKKNLKKSFIG